MHGQVTLWRVGAPETVYANVCTLSCTSAGATAGGAAAGRFGTLFLIVVRMGMALADKLTVLLSQQIKAVLEGKIERLSNHIVS